MKDNIQLLDCTLRDGAYIVNADFGESLIRGLLKRLYAANIEIIECGWLKNTPHPEGSSFFHKPDDLLPYLPEEPKEGRILSVMIDWDRYDLSGLPPCDGKTVDAIRMVFPRGKAKEAVELSKTIVDRGYRLFFQAANTLGYSDGELGELAEMVNGSGAAALSIVDTFGAMYPRDLERIFRMLDSALAPEIRLGFHSHNNQQLSFALSMEFVGMKKSTARKLAVDASLSGMGRGAGNATTELVASFLNREYSGNYDMNEILDAIDTYIEPLKARYSWGYSTPYFIAGTYCCHVNNIAYLLNNHRTMSKDMRLIIESLSPEMRLKYDYDNLEKIFMNYSGKVVDDDAAKKYLGSVFRGREILLLAPGRSIGSRREEISEFIRKEKPIVAGINSVPENYDCDFLFFSKPNRYLYAKEKYADRFAAAKKILTSNVKTEGAEDEFIVNYNLLVKLGWIYFDDSVIMFLRLLEKLDARQIAIAGFDGFSLTDPYTYADPFLQGNLSLEKRKSLNKDISSMLRDLTVSSGDRMKLRFLTPSIYEENI